MRKFIVSDIHGLGNVYYSIMHYLDNVSKYEEIELYINGDLIDRGIESAEILLDVKNRIEQNNYKIIYLGGNHELMMYEVFLKRRKEITTFGCDWWLNGGCVTDDGLGDILNYDADRVFEIADFVSNLKIYHKFKEKIANKNIVLVHAACPIRVDDICSLSIKDNNIGVFYYVWTRENNSFMPFRCRIGNGNYFSIIGHTPNNNKFGFEYHESGNYLNIDGGCSRYACGDFQYDHVPLVEVHNGYLRILTFNNNNEIIYGNYFINDRSHPMDADELNKEREYLDYNLKIKKLVKLKDGIIGYEN